MTVRATNDNGTGGTTRAPVRSSLPEGYRSIPPAFSIHEDGSRFSDMESAHSQVGGRFLDQSVTSAASSDCLGEPSRQSPSLLRWFQDTRGGCASRKAAKPPLKAQTGWSFWTDHPVRAFQRMPSAILFDGTATPPVPGGDYAIQTFQTQTRPEFANWHL